MATVLWDPFPALRTRRPAPAAASWTPSVDVERTEEATFVRLDVPGVRPDDLEVSVIDHVLAIRGERRTGSSSMTFERRFTLPDHVDPGSIEATHEHGVLELRVPVAKPERRVVPIAIRREGEVEQGTRPEAIEVEGASAN